MLELTNLRLNKIQLTSEKQKTVKGGLLGAGGGGIGSMAAYSTSARDTGRFSGRTFFDRGLSGGLTGGLFGFLGTGTLTGTALSGDE